MLGGNRAKATVRVFERSGSDPVDWAMCGDEPTRVGKRAGAALRCSFPRRREVEGIGQPSLSPIPGRKATGSTTMRVGDACSSKDRRQPARRASSFPGRLISLRQSAVNPPHGSGGFPRPGIRIMRLGRARTVAAPARARSRSPGSAKEPAVGRDVVPRLGPVAATRRPRWLGR